MTRAREVASAEARGRAEEAKRTAATVRVAVEEAVVHTMARIKPALQKQEEVEAAIRRAEERAREMERMQASQVENRIKELAQDVASQPAAQREISAVELRALFDAHGLPRTNGKLGLAKSTALARVPPPRASLVHSPSSQVFQCGHEWVRPCPIQRII